MKYYFSSSKYFMHDMKQVEKWNSCMQFRNGSLFSKEIDRK